MRRRDRSDTVSLAGWLFADLLLTLVVVTLASGAGRSSGAESAGGEGVADRVTVTETTQDRVEVEGVEQEPHRFEIVGDYSVLMGPEGPAKAAEQARIVGEIQSHFEQAGVTTRRVGFVLTFGVHPSPSEGTALARSFNGLLRFAEPEMFEGATMRDFWNASGPTGLARFEVYFMR